MEGVTKWPNCRHFGAAFSAEVAAEGTVREHQPTERLGADQPGACLNGIMGCRNGGG
jgi:hypothetical protein